MQTGRMQGDARGHCVVVNVCTGYIFCALSSCQTLLGFQGRQRGASKYRTSKLPSCFFGKGILDREGMRGRREKSREEAASSRDAGCGGGGHVVLCM